MLKASKEFIDDLKSVFEKHCVVLDVSDEYDGEDNYFGQSVEIRSVNYEGDELPIYIDDIEELAKQININTRLKL